MKQSVTIAEAAVLVSRSTKTIYEWTRRKTNRLPCWIGNNGKTLVRVEDLFKAEAAAKPGRPRKTPRRN